MSLLRIGNREFEGDVEIDRHGVIYVDGKQVATVKECRIPAKSRRSEVRWMEIGVVAVALIFIVIAFTR